MLFHSILLSSKKISDKFYICTLLSPTIVEAFTPLSSLKITLAEDGFEASYFSIFDVKPTEDVYEILVEHKNQFTEKLINLPVGSVIYSGAPQHFNQFEWFSQEHKLIIATGSGLSIFYHVLQKDIGINKTWIIYAADDLALDNIINYFKTPYNQTQIITHYYQDVGNYIADLVTIAIDVIKQHAITRVLLCTMDDKIFINAFKHLSVIINQ